MKNGRCRFHGGRTPTGKDWHRLQAPSPNSTRANALARKIKRVEERRAKRAAEREAKFAAMTPEQKAAHDRQYGRRVMDPGPAAGRDRKRAARKNSEWLRELLSEPKNVAGSVTGEPKPQPVQRKVGRRRKSTLAAPAPVSGGPGAGQAGQHDWRQYREGIFA